MSPTRPSAKNIRLEKLNLRVDRVCKRDAAVAGAV